MKHRKAFFPKRTISGGALLLALVSLVSGCDESTESDGGGGSSGSGAGGESTSPETGTGGSSYEAPASCQPLLDPLVGEYPVTDSAADHDRGTILIEASGAIDFDTDVSFEPSEIEVCYDRTMQDFDRRVQVSYGADDDGPVINIYLDADLVPTEIEYRNRNEMIERRVEVGPASEP